ncbi:hypothetical protein C0Z18_14880 [Trinickia dabaoshanensis]|uniref:DNA gyrase subunit B n=1 Tax=Trinickia dabaoshanensis TaxID=564714 RepID=A0A2N7VPK5_9BURK|nr:hypothetical protein [Trinickia dabaoshanensis]PMS19100.1 hypothetical protein C0Z18_14880 [Trinickia dabaoshanensis]
MRAAPTRAAPAPSCRRARVAASIALRIAYPVVILACLRIGSPRFIGIALLALLWLQRVLGAGSLGALLAKFTRLEWAAALAMTGLSAAIAVTGSEALLRAYPIVVNASMFVAFGATLVGGGPSMIEKFARVRRPELDARAVRYTRRVTQVWCAFFVINGAVSAACAIWGSRAQWALYNGLVTYLLIGMLIAGEIAWRHAFVLREKTR